MAVILTKLWTNWKKKNACLKIALVRYTPLITALGRQADLCGFKASLVYSVSSRTELLYRGTQSWKKRKRKMVYVGARKMAQWLRVLAALPQGRVEFPAPTRWLTTAYNSSSRGSNTLSWPLRATDMHTVHIHACKHTYTENENYNKKCLWVQNSLKICKNPLKVKMLNILSGNERQGVIE